MSFRLYDNNQPDFNFSINKVTRTIVSSTNSPGFIVSELNNSFVSYNFSFTTTDFVLDAQVYLEISQDNINWTILDQSGLTTPSAPPVSIKVGSLNGFIPKGSYVRLRSQNDANSSVVYLDGTEYSITVT